MARVVLGGSNAYREVTGDKKSMTAKIDRTSRSVTRYFIIEDPTHTYGPVNAFIAECRPVFGPPGRFPLNGSQLYVDEVTIEPFGAVAKTGSGTPIKYQEFPAYEEWLATVTYTPLTYTPENPQQPTIVANLEITQDIGAEAMTLPGSRLYYQGDTDPIGDESVAAAIRIDTIEHSVTKHHVDPKKIPFSAIRTVNNRVNAVAFGANHPIFPGVKAETLLFRGMQTALAAASDGSIETQLTYVFSERTARVDDIDVTWNHLYDASAGQQKFRKVQREGTFGVKPLYETATVAEFEDLFTT